MKIEFIQLILVLGSEMKRWFKIGRNNILMTGILPKGVIYILFYYFGNISDFIDFFSLKLYPIVSLDQH